MSVMTERVTHVHHWNDNLFSFRLLETLAIDLKMVISQ